MAKKGSERRKKQLGVLSLNLNPMMDMFAVLIPALLMMTVVVESAVVNVSVPAIGGPPPTDAPPKAPDQVPLNLTVNVTEEGYILVAAGQVVGGGDPAAMAARRPNIPLVQKSVQCSQFRGTAPPPRTKNKEKAPCDPAQPMETKTFYAYDTDTLNQKVAEIKDLYPEEKRVIIAADSTIEFEAISDAMDATRDIKPEGGEIRVLFDEVVISPGM